jgi:hypothetical protein
VFEAQDVVAMGARKPQRIGRRVEINRSFKTLGLQSLRDQPREVFS